MPFDTALCWWQSTKTVSNKDGKSDLPFIKEVFQQTLKEVQSENIAEKPSETETETRISELKSDHSHPKSSKQSDGKFDSNIFKSESKIPSKSVFSCFS